MQMRQSGGRRKIQDKVDINKAFVLGATQRFNNHYVAFMSVQVQKTIIAHYNKVLNELSKEYVRILESMKNGN